MARSKASANNNITIEFKAKGEKQLIAAIQALSGSTSALAGSQKQLGATIGLTEKAQKKQIATGALAMRNQRNMNAAVNEGNFSLSVFRSRLLLAAFAVTLYAASVGRLFRAFQEQESSERRLSAAVASTGGVAGVSAEKIKEMTAALEDTGVVGDETNNKVAALLLTFTNIRGEAFERTLQATNDMAIGIAQGIPNFEELRSTAIQLGKALQDPIGQLGALSRSGFTFTDQQKEQIKILAKSGKMFEAQTIILDAAETQFGGLTEAMRATSEGAMAALGNAVGTVAEDFGEFFAPSIVATANALEDFFKSIHENKELLFAFLNTTKQIAIAFGVYKVVSLAVINRTLVMAKAFAIARAALHPVTGLLVFLGTVMMAANTRTELLKEQTEDLDDVFSRFGVNTGDAADDVSKAIEKISGKYKELVLASEGRLTSIKLENAAQKGLSEEDVRALQKRREQIEVEKILLTIDKEKRDESRSAVTLLVRKRFEYDLMVSTLKNNIKAEKELLDLQVKAGELLQNSTIDTVTEQAKVNALLATTTDDAHAAEKLRIDQLVEYNNKLKEAGLTQIDLAGAIETGMSVDDFMQPAIEGVFNLNNEFIKLIISLGLYNEKLEQSKTNTEELTALQKLQANETFIALQNGLTSFQNMQQAVSQSVDARMQRELEALKASREYEQATIEEREIMQNRVEQKFKAQRKRAFRMEKAANLATAAMQTAEAISKANPNPALMAFAAAMGAAQIAAISSQPSPKFAVGGSFTTSGPRNITVGEQGAEQVTIRPLGGQARMNAGNNQTININVSAPLVDETILDVIIPKIEEAAELNL